MPIYLKVATKSLYYKDSVLIIWRLSENASWFVTENHINGDFLLYWF